MKATHYEILKRPLLTEKGTVLRDDQNKFMFEVAMASNKTEIRKAVEKLFDVRVLDVHTSIVRGKNKRVGRFIGQKPNWKKAVVTLHPEDSIEVYEGV